MLKHVPGTEHGILGEAEDQSLVTVNQDIQHGRGMSSEDGGRARWNIGVPEPHSMVYTASDQEIQAVAVVKTDHTL